MNKIFLVLYLAIIGVLLAMFFIGPNLMLNKFIVLGAILLTFIIVTFFFDIHIYDKMEHIQKLKIERGFKLISAKLFLYVAAIVIALIFFFWLMSTGYLDKFMSGGAQSNTNVNGEKISCSDPDKEDYFTKGTTQLTVSGIGMPKESDSCIDVDTLKEKVCGEGKIVEKIVKCISIKPSSKCDDGKCIEIISTNTTQNISILNTSLVTANQTNFSQINLTDFISMINLTINENDVNKWNSTGYVGNETTKYVTVKINPTGPPIVTHLVARPDGFDDTGMVDDDTQIFITWDLIATFNTKCYGAFGDKSSMREIGIDGLDVAPALKGYNTFYMRCCNKNACDYEQTQIKVEIS